MVQLDENWRTRRASSPIDPVMRFASEGLVLGAGTLLARAGTSHRDIAVDTTEPRLLALLSSAHQQLPTATALTHVRKAAERWSAGEDVLAAIHLALSRLERLRQPEADARRLFLAEMLLEAGLEPEALLKALDIGASEALTKYSPDQLRAPAGSGRASGEWTTGGGDSGSAPVPYSAGAERAVPGQASSPPAALAASDRGVDANSTERPGMFAATGPTNIIEFAVPGAKTFSLNVPSNWSRVLPDAPPGFASVSISATTGGRDKLEEANDHVVMIANSGDGSGYYNIPSWVDLKQLVALANDIKTLPLPIRVSVVTQVAGPGGPLDYKWMTTEKQPIYDYSTGASGGHESVWVPIGNWAFGFVSELGGIKNAGPLYSAERVFQGRGLDTTNHQADIAAGAAAARVYQRTGALPRVVDSVLDPMAAPDSW